MARLRQYIRRLERKFRRRKQRRGFNFLCDVYLAARVRAIARHLETPLYPLMEQIVQFGLSEIVEIMQDDALREGLQRHLLEDHLCVQCLDPEVQIVSGRVRRLRAALRLLRFCEMREVTVDDLVEALRAAEIKTLKRKE